MFPREYLPTQGQDDSSTAGVFQCTVLYHTILYKMFLEIAAISGTQVHGTEDEPHNSAVECSLHSGQGVGEGGSGVGRAGVGAGAHKGF